MSSVSEFRKFIGYGILAPSGHNTQPWKFKVTQNEIQIHPDFHRSLPIADGDNHALYISLGCAAENIILAAENAGYRTDLKIVKDITGIEFISITLSPIDKKKEDELFQYIQERQVTRNAYTHEKVSSEDLKILFDSAKIPGVEVRSFIAQNEIRELEHFIIEGSNHQFRNSDFTNELVSWIRFSKKEIEHKRDGIWHASMGFPKTGRLLGSLIMKKLVSSASEAKRWKKLVKASAGFILFIAEENDVKHWVNMGRAFQRFGLTACKLGIHHAHVNMPCEEVEVRRKMTKSLNLGTGHPLLLIRFGYSEKMPYSYRRPLEDVLEELQSYTSTPNERKTPELA